MPKKDNPESSIKIVITNDDIEEYANYYFIAHPRAQKKPIPLPYHESINKWMIMKRPAMNALKQKWKDFIHWIVRKRGYVDLGIEECEIEQTIYFKTNRPHDVDNTVPKFILDGLVESGMLVSDDSKHVTKLTLQCFTDKENPRTELEFLIKKQIDEKDGIEDGKKKNSENGAKEDCGSGSLQSDGREN